MISSITVQDVRNYIPILLRKTKIQAIVHGNATKEEALALVESFEKAIGFHATAASGNNVATADREVSKGKLVRLL